MKQKNKRIRRQNKKIKTSIDKLNHLIKTKLDCQGNTSRL